MSQQQVQAQAQPEKPQDPYQKYKDFKWQNPDQFKNGPIDDETRKCRDCICCIIFILIVILCVVVAAFGFKKGKPSQLFYFYDEDAKACGHDEGYEDYPYLYFVNVINGLKSFDTNKMLEAVCVKKCPTKKSEVEISGDTAHVMLECHTTSKRSDCKIDAKNFYESKEFIKKICFPKSNDEIQYDSSSQTLVEIYDPETGETFKKVVNNDDTTWNIAHTRVYIAQDIIDGSKDPKEASARLINLSYFTQLFTLWINDLYVTRYAIIASIGWSFFLAMFYFLFKMLCWIYYLLNHNVSSSRFNSISCLL